MSKNTESALEWVDITPDMASRVLERHYQRIAEGSFRNRPVAGGRVTRYAADMENGNWQKSPVPVIFDENEDLIDGQHRLEAIRKSGKTIRMVISKGWNSSNSTAPGLIDLLDTGWGRSVNQMLHMHGWKFAKNYATCANFVCRVAWGGASASLTYSSTLSVLNESGIKEAIDRIMSRGAGAGNNFRDFQGRIIGPLAYYFTARPKRAMDFASSLFNFETTKGSPVATFLRWVKNRGTVPTETFVKGICAAIRAWDSNEEIEYIKPNAEAVEWLANLNPQFRARIRSTIPRNASRGPKPPGEIKMKAKAKA